MLGSAQSRVTIPPERERYNIDAKLFDWSDEITADCPRKEARNLNDQCGGRCPDLPKVCRRWCDGQSYRFLEYRVSIDPDQRYINERMSFDFSSDPSRN